MISTARTPRERVYVTTYDRLPCTWCGGQNPPTAVSCDSCGAPLDVADMVSDAGWRAAPRIRDTTRFHFGRSECEVEGEIVPVAEVTLGEGDGVFFEYHTLLWKDEHVALGSLRIGGGLKRIFGGMPFVITTAGGPGRIAFSRDSPGELVVLPLHPQHEVDVREHGFLVGTHSIEYSFVRIDGLGNMFRGGSGMYMERFVTSGEPGLLMLHGSGNVFERRLAPGESVLVEPGAFLYKDSTVAMEVEKQDVKVGVVRNLYLVRFTGPGRLGIQSMYHPHSGGSEE
jgi:uncharacterized protein (AIM24 family)